MVLFYGVYSIKKLILLKAKTEIRTSKLKVSLFPYLSTKAYSQNLLIYKQLQLVPSNQGHFDT